MLFSETIVFFDALCGLLRMFGSASVFLPMLLASFKTAGIHAAIFGLPWHHSVWASAAMVGQASGRHRARSSMMQDWVLFAMYLKEDTWRVVKDQDRRDHEVLDRLVGGLHALGLRHPTEPCQAALTSLLLLRKDGASVATVSEQQTPTQLRSLYLTVKSFIGTKLHKLKVGQPTITAEEYLIELPANPADLPRSVQDKWFPLTTPVIDPMEIVNLAKTIPLRSDHRLLRDPMGSQGSGGNVAFDPWAKIGLMLLASQTLMGPGANAAMAGMIGSQHVPAQHGPLALCDRPTSGLPALLSRAQSSSNVGTVPEPQLQLALPNPSQPANVAGQESRACPASAGHGWATEPGCHRHRTHDD